MRVDEVADLTARPVALDETGPVEDREVLDHRLPADRQCGGHCGGGSRAVGGQDIEDPPPHRVGECGQHVLDRFALGGHGTSWLHISVSPDHVHLLIVERSEMCPDFTGSSSERP
jgi:hypothetical protein